MTARLFISPSRQIIFCTLHYLVFTRQLVTLETTTGENSNAKSVSPIEGPKNMVSPDQVKAVIDSENSLTNKVLSNGMSTLDVLQKGASSTVNNLGWFATSLLSNTLRVLSNTMEAVKDVGSNTLSAGVRVGMNTASVAGGAVRNILGYAKTGTHVVEGQLNNTSSYFKHISKNPESVHLIPQTISSNLPSIDSAKVVYNATLSSAGTIGWLITDTLADIDQVLGNTVELLDNLLDTTADTGYKLGENGVMLTQNVVGGGYNLVENGVASAGVKMEGLSKSFKDRLQPQQLVDVPLVEKPALRTIKIKANPKK